MAYSTNQIDLSWNNVDGVTDYKIYRAASPGGTFSLIGTTAADLTTYSDVGLNVFDDDCYKIKAYNSEEESDFSNESCSTTLPLPPLAPENLVATTYSSSEINLSWSNVNNETGYKIYRAFLPGGTYSLID